MVSAPTLLRLQAEFDNSPESVQAVTALLESGATPDFIAHFRRDETGDIGETRIFELAERLHFLEDLETRKEAIRKQAAERSEGTEELHRTLAECFDQDLLDDIYQTFRPSRRTPAVQAREKGLGEVADKIRRGALEQDLATAADGYISAEKDLPTREAVLEGVLHILVEDLVSDPVLRSRARRELHGGVLVVSCKNDKGKGASRYKAYFEYQQPVRRVQGNHLLNIWRGEREGVLGVQVTLPEGKGVELIKKFAAIDAKGDEVLEQFLGLVYQHAFEHVLLPSIEADVRHQIKERVDRTTAKNLARNLRSQLMAPPLGHKRALGIRASRNTVWLALLGEDGSLQKHETLGVEGDEKREAAVQTVAALLDSEQPVGIALPHGRHQDVTAELVQAAVARATNKSVIVVPVDEAASAIHATSASARREWPGLEVGVRTAISLASRLQDSMHELLGLDPKALGLGHALDEVHQGLLTRTLDETIASCIAKVGMDVNRASIAHLARVPGMTRELAKNVFEHRKKSGPFRTREQLRADGLLDDLRFRQVAGFLRVIGGDQPLDAMGIHPEHYALVERIAAAEGCTSAELCGRRVRTPASEFVDDQHGILLVKDVISALSRCGEDVRGSLAKVHNDAVARIEDLRPDMELRGRVTNLTEFGAFVDIGIHQDGLVHISQIPANRLKDPRRMLAVGEVIQVFVQQVDPEKKRISLSMHRPRHLVEGRQPTIGERLEQGAGRRRRGREAPASEPMSRAARAPEGRRKGGMRTGPRPKAGAGAEDRAGPRMGGGFGGGRGRGDRDRDRGQTPRVVTIESERPAGQARGHKGELRSLSSLAGLLRGAQPVEPDPRDEPPNPAEIEPRAEAPREAGPPADLGGSTLVAPASGATDAGTRSHDEGSASPPHS